MSKSLVQKTGQFPEKQAPKDKTNRSTKFGASYKFPAPNYDHPCFYDVSQVGN